MPRSDTVNSATVLLRDGRVIRVVQALETATGVVVVDRLGRRFPIEAVVSYTPEG